MARGNFGERLKRERELREVSMDELTKATRISARFIGALENEDWDKLPGGIFGHGFVRAIARYLGLDEEALLGEYDLARAEKSASVPAKPEQRIPAPPKWLPAVAVVVILLLVIGLFYAARHTWRRYASHRAAKQGATRVPIFANNQLLLSTEFPAGVARHFSANQQFVVTAGDLSAVLLELNGQALPRAGAPGGSGTMVLTQKDLRQASRGNSEP